MGSSDTVDTGSGKVPSCSGGVRHVVIVDDIPTPYRIALFKAIKIISPFHISIVWLAAEGREKLWKLDVAEGGLDIYSAKDWQLYVPSLDRRFTFSRDLGSIITRLSPDLLVTGGYHQTGYWQCLAYAKARRIPLICWSGATPANERSSSRVIHALKSFYLRRCAGLIAYGSDAAELFRSRGCNPQNIYKMYNTTDLAGVRAATRAIRGECDSERGPLRLLSVGRLMKDKGIQCLLEPLARLRDDYPFELRVVGDGPYRKELEAAVRGSGLSDRVDFVGYAQQHELPKHFAWGDVFVFPSSYDAWGIVVNEALAGGLYVLSSVLAGVTTDLIDPILSGRPFDPRNTESVERGLREVLRNTKWIRSTRDQRSDWVLRFDATEAAKVFVQACTCTWRRSRRDMNTHRLDIGNMK